MWKTNGTTTVQPLTGPMRERKDLTIEEFRLFQEFIYAMSGIRIPESKRTLLSNRIRRRLNARDVADFQSYYRYVRSKQDEDEMVHFLNAVTTNETSFFRTEAHFEWFKSKYISETLLAARSGSRDKRLRVWSAACSSGEEPYSIGICLLENQLRLSDWSLQVVGTDLSEDALDVARQGVYPERTVEGLNEKRLRRFFTKHDSPAGWRVRGELRDLVQFERHNLLEPIRHEPFDCIWIRNVLIYFDRQSKQRAVKHLIDALADGGYLVVGPSEGIFDMLGSLHKHTTFLYQK